MINEICSLGFFNRGVKDGSHLYVLKNTCIPAIFVEYCFVDSAMDINLLNADRMAGAIVKGLTGECPATPAKSPDRAAKWQEFINVLKAANVAYPQLKPAQLAQAIL